MGNCISEKQNNFDGDNSENKSKYKSRRSFSQSKTDEIKKTNELNKIILKSPIKQYRTTQDQFKSELIHPNEKESFQRTNKKVNTQVSSKKLVRNQSKSNLIQHKPLLDILALFNKKNPTDFYKKLQLVKKYDDNYKIMKIISIENNIIYSVKQILIDPYNTNFKNEANNLDFQLMLDHPHIIKFNESFSNENNLYIVYESSKNGYLSEIIENFANLGHYHASLIIYQLFQALHYLNNKKIMHRNIKPDNILVSDFKIDDKYFYVKICDFRNAKFFDDNMKENELIGSADFIAPEVLKAQYNEKCDVWSLGIIFYMMIEGKSPFEAETQEKLKRNILDEDPTFSKKTSSDLKEFLMQMLHKNPEKRLNCQDILKHKYFEKLGFFEKFNLKSNEALEILENFDDKYLGLKEEFINLIVKDIKMTNEVFFRELVFNSISQNTKEKISYKDIKLYFQNLKTGKEINTQIGNIFKILKKNGQKKITFEEFIKYTIDANIVLKNSELIYNLIRAKNKYVNLSEFSKILKSNEKLLKIYQELEIDEVANLNYNDFMNIFKKLI